MFELKIPPSFSLKILKKNINNLFKYLFSSPTIDLNHLKSTEHDVQIVNHHAPQQNGGSCNSGSSGRSTPTISTDPAPGKLFVGGLSWQTSSEKLREYFGMFGTVTDVLIMKDPVTQVRVQHHPLNPLPFSFSQSTHPSISFYPCNTTV